MTRRRIFFLRRLWTCMNGLGADHNFATEYNLWHKIASRLLDGGSLLYVPTSTFKLRTLPRLSSDLPRCAKVIQLFRALTRS